MGKNPTDRGKLGTKRSVLTEGSGLPIAVVVDGANRNDFKLARATLEEAPVPIPDEETVETVGLCLDKGYDYQEVRDLLDEFGIVPHIRSRGEEKQALKRDLGHRARRWVVERVHSWMNRFRRVLVRWEKYAETYIAMLHIACGIITWRAVQRAAGGLLK